MEVRKKRMARSERLREKKILIIVRKNENKRA